MLDFSLEFRGQGLRISLFFYSKEEYDTLMDGVNSIQIRIRKGVKDLDKLEQLNPKPDGSTIHSKTSLTYFLNGKSA